MKKPYKNTEFSLTRKCDKCHKPMKMNLLHKISKAELCYKCFYPLDMLRRGIRVTPTGASSIEFTIMIIALIAGIGIGAFLFGGFVKSLFDSVAHVGLVP